MLESVVPGPATSERIARDENVFDLKARAVNLARVVPGLMKPMLNRLYRLARSCIRRITQRHRSLEETHAYWGSPPETRNAPEGYFLPNDRSRFPLGLVESHVRPEARILEIGRNLAHLHSAGYRNLVGVEISGQALELMRKRYPEAAADATLINLPIEHAIRELAAAEFDLVFTMAVLEHIHKEGEWVFSEIVRITRKYLVTIEDKEGYSWRHFPRNYRKVFEPLGMEELTALNCVEQGLRLPGGFYARVFSRSGAQ